MTHSLPFWIHMAFPIVLLCAAFYCGYILGRKNTQAQYVDSNIQDNDGNLILSIAMGLLSLLIAFIFGFVLSWENTRKVAGTEQVVTIGTAFNTAELLDDPDKTQLKKALLEFARTRNWESPASLSNEELRALSKAGHDARLTLQSTAKVAISGDVPAPIRVAINSSVNDALDAWERLRKAMTEKIAHAARRVFLIMSAGTMILTGHCAGRKKTVRPWAWFCIPILLGLVSAFTIDIENPKNGFVRVENPALDTLISEMEADLENTQN